MTPKSAKVNVKSQKKEVTAPKKRTEVPSKVVLGSKMQTGTGWRRMKQKQHKS